MHRPQEGRCVAGDDYPPVVFANEWGVSNHSSDFFESAAAGLHALLAGVVSVSCPTGRVFLPFR